MLLFFLLSAFLAQSCSLKDLFLRINSSICQIKEVYLVVKQRSYLEIQESGYLSPYNNEEVMLWRTKQGLL